VKTVHRSSASVPLAKSAPPELPARQRTNSQRSTTAPGQSASPSAPPAPREAQSAKTHCTETTESARGRSPVNLKCAAPPAKWARQPVKFDASNAASLSTPPIAPPSAEAQFANRQPETESAQQKRERAPPGRPPALRRSVKVQRAKRTDERQSGPLDGDERV
jgi:hypothetical protein